MVAKKRIQTFYKPNLWALVLFILTLSSLDGFRKRMITVATHNFISPNMFFPLVLRQAGLIKSATGWEGKILSPNILCEVNKDTQPSTPATRSGKMEGGGAEEDKSSYPTVMELALANLLSSTSICSTLICLHWVLVQLSMLLWKRMSR